MSSPRDSLLIVLVCCCRWRRASRNDDAPLVGTLERDRIEIIAEEAEPILSLEVREGDHVEAGQVLMRQETGVAAARIAQADAQVEEARHRLDGAASGARARRRSRRRAHASRRRGPRRIATSASSRASKSW